MDLSSTIAAFDAVLFERLEGNRFARKSGAPIWYQRIVQDEDSEQALVLSDAFPFLEIFLPNAERAWQSPASTPIGSELWTQKDNSGQEIHLEAKAIRVNGSAVLLILRNDEMFVQGQLLLQRARALKQTYDALMHEIERKDILLHTIVHDLTAPLHSIVGALSLLQEMALPAAAIRWTEIAVTAANRQRALIQTILSIFVAEHGGAELPDPQGVDLACAIQRAVAEREPVARQRQVEITLELNDARRVVADETRLLRVLTNLLDNALAHSPPKSQIRMATVRDDGSIRLTVEDQGPGVTTDMLPRLFEKLGRNPRGQGSGLGLYFCRITIEQWGGGIGYEPRPTGGSVFWIRLPAILAKQRRSDMSDDAGAGQGRRDNGQATLAR